MADDKENHQRPIWDLGGIAPELAGAHDPQAMANGFLEASTEVAREIAQVFSTQIRTTNANPTVESVTDTVNDYLALNHRIRQLQDAYTLLRDEQLHHPQQHVFYEHSWETTLGLTDLLRDAFQELSLDDITLQALGTQSPSLPIWVDEIRRQISSTASVDQAPAEPASQEAISLRASGDALGLYLAAITDPAYALDDRDKAEALVEALDMSLYQGYLMAKKEGVTTPSLFDRKEGVKDGFLLDLLDQNLEILSETADELAFEFDAAVPNYSWQDAQSIVLTAFHSFHPELGKKAAELFASDRIHAGVEATKRGDPMAYSMANAVVGVGGAIIARADEPYISVPFTGSPDSVVNLGHEVAHAIAMSLEADARGSYFERTDSLTLHETFALMGEFLTKGQMLELASTPEIRLTLLQAFTQEEAANLTTFDRVPVELALHSLIADNPDQPLTVETVAQALKDFQLYAEDTPAEEAIIDFYSQQHQPFRPSQPLYNASYILASQGAMAVRDVWKSMETPQAKESFAQNWMDTMRNYSAMNYAQALEQVGIDVMQSGPEALLQATERHLDERLDTIDTTRTICDLRKKLTEAAVKPDETSAVKDDWTTRAEKAARMMRHQQEKGAER